MDVLRVLVVDDEAGMCKGAMRVLDGFRVALPEMDGHVCVQMDKAESGEEALDKMAAQKYDILLLDHKLPGMSGLDLLEQLNQRRDDVLVIMITAYASLDVAINATKRGAFDFLAKPFTPEELRDAVRKAARHHILRWQARKLAQEKRQVRFQFLTVLVHELKAPLAAVEGYLRLLQEGAAEDPATVARVVERSLVRLDGMRKLIVDLLDLTRIESGQKVREFSEVDVVDVARAALETAQPAARERGLTMALHAAGPVVMWADRGEIEIMLNNLVSNAVKYNRDGGHVVVRIDRIPSSQNRGERLSVTVEDDGPGIAPEHLPRLTERFYRVSAAASREKGGTGLGLAIVKNVVARHRGELEITSTIGVGSKFRVILDSVGGDQVLPTSQNQLK